MPQDFSGDIISLVLQSGPMAKFVLFILLVFSVASWAIMVEKHFLIRKARRQSREFLTVFRKSSKFSEVKAICDDLHHSPLVGLFLAGFNELNFQLRASLKHQGATADDPQSRATIHNIEGISRALLRATAVEINKLERTLNFLATTGAITPFIGLFGTVWGIMSSFHMIGVTGSASLAAVAPGISEALIATAAGLAAAVPAVIGYNYFINKIRVVDSEMEDFALEFLSISERNFT
jgi:biopolymer transport protein TolQ